ncbi:MAG: hypothetical protein HY235_07930 [Acidobacteria bacterium]|nr:hypothetical protein [Acidobacteriota bacterium]
MEAGPAFALLAMVGLWLLFFAAPVELPQDARAMLERRYRGWKLAPAAVQIASWFEQSRLPYLPNLVPGDFNKDGRTDYAVQILRRSRQQVLALVASGKGYSLHKLAADEPDPFTFLILYHRGEKDFDFERMKPFRYAADSLGVLYPRKTALTFTWRDGKFQKRAAPGDEEVEAAAGR